MTRSLHHPCRPQASSCSPEGEETLRPPRSDLRSLGKISRLGRPPCSRWEFSQKVKERMTWGDQSFEELIPFFIFQGPVFIHRDVIQKSCRVSSPDFYKNQALHTNVYKGLRGVTSSSGQGACWQFMTLSLWQRSTRTLISPGVIILKTDATQIKLHSYRVRV